MSDLKLGTTKEKYVSAEDFQPDMSRLQTFRSATRLSNMDSPENSMMFTDAVNRENSKSEVKLQPDELNKMFENQVDIPFSSPMSLEAANIIVERTRERRQLQNIIQNGPQDVTQSFLNFTGALTGQMTPMNIASGYAMGGMFRVLSLGMRASKVNQLVKAGDKIKDLQQAGKLTKTGLAVDAAENFLGNLTVEPVVYQANKLEQREYTVKDMFENAMLGALVGTGFRVGVSGIKFAGGYLKDNGADWLLKRGPDEIEDSIRHNIEMDAMDKMPKHNEKIQAMVEERSGTKIPYEHSLLNLNKNKGVKFYSYSNKTSKDMLQFHSRIGEDIYGNGVFVMTTDPNHVFGEAKKGGSIHQVQVISDMNLFDLDQPFDGNLKNKVEQIIKENNIKGIDLDNMTAKEVHEQIKINAEDVKDIEAIDDINLALLEEGFDGKKYFTDSLLGQKINPQDIVAAFDTVKLQHNAAFKGDKRLLNNIIPRDAKKELDYIDDKKTSIFYSDDLKEYLEFEPDSFKENKRIDIEKEIKELDEELNNLKEIEALSESELKTIEETKNIAKESEQGLLASMKAMMDCFGRRSG